MLLITVLYRISTSWFSSNTRLFEKPGASGPGFFVSWPNQVFRRPLSLQRLPPIPQLVATLTCVGAPPEASLSGEPVPALRSSATGRHADLRWSGARGVLVRRTCPNWSGRPRVTATEAPQHHIAQATTCGKSATPSRRPLAENREATAPVISLRRPLAENRQRG